MFSESGTGLNLDEGQRHALKAFREGRCIALLGGAGCGKSFLLNLLIREAERRHGGYPFVVPCALSNKAAEAINGVTIHRLFAAKPSWEFSKEYLLDGIRKNPRLCKVLKTMQVFFIDEISLLTSNVIDAVDYVLRELSQSERHSSVPFGGRQVVFAGDPFQLEPYAESGCIQLESMHASYESRSWYLTFGPLGDGIVVLLKTNHRQRTDKEFYELLTRLRVGKQTPEDIELLNGSSPQMQNPPNGHTRLCLTNLQASLINEGNLKELPGPVIMCKAFDRHYYGDSKTLESKLRRVAPTEIFLKVKARVILTRRIGDIMPGTKAVVRNVLGLTTSADHTRFPIEVEVEICPSPHTCGEKRTATSPGKFLRICSARYDVHSYERKVIASREQLPLIPAYAITIHRCQGMTLDNVAVDFEMANNWRPNGMVYVALSRCKTFSGLWVRHLQNELVAVSTKAKLFMSELWNLHLNLPSRIWGVENIESLFLDEECSFVRPSGLILDDRASMYIPQLPRICLSQPIGINAQEKQQNARAFGNICSNSIESNSRFSTQYTNATKKPISKTRSTVSKGKFVFKVVSGRVISREDELGSENREVNKL